MSNSVSLGKNQVSTVGIQPTEGKQKEELKRTEEKFLVL